MRPPLLPEDLLRHLQPPPARAAWAGFLLVLALIFGIPIALHFIAAANAQEGAGFSDQECQALARFARTSAEIRDIDADMNKHLQLVRRRVAEGGMQLSELIERELVRVYAEGLAPEAAEQSTHTRCMTGEILRKEG